MTAIARAMRALPRQLSAIRYAWHTIDTNPDSRKLTFVAVPSSAREVICAEPGIVNRIGITNNSFSVALDCELTLVSCSLDIPGLMLPTPMPLKASTSKTKVEIKSGETQYFDLFGAFLNPAIDWPERTFLWVSNYPYVPKMKPTRADALFSLTGSNFQPQFWKGKIRIDQGDARLEYLVPVRSSMQEDAA